MRFFETTAAVLASNIAALFTVLVTNLLISRTLGASGKGLVSLYLNIGEVIYIVGSLGLATAVQYFVSRKEGDVRAHLGNLLFVPLAVGALLCALFVASYSWWRPYLQDLPLQAILPALVVIVPTFVFECLAQLLLALQRVGERSLAVFLRGVAAMLIVGAVLLLPQASAATVMWGYSAAWSGAAVLVLYFAVKAVGRPRRPSPVLLKKTLGFGIWVYVTNVARHAFQKVDFLLVFAMLDTAAAGVYSVATGLTSALLMIPLAVQSVYFPKTAAQTEAEAQLTTPFYFRQMALFMTAGAIACVICARPVLYLFGPEFLLAQWPFAILLVGAILKGVNGILATYLLGRGHAHLITVVTIITFLCGAALNYVMISHWSLIGAAVATVAAYAVQGVVLIGLYVRRGGGQLEPLLRFKRSDIVTAWQSSLRLVAAVRRRQSSGRL